MRYLFLVLFIAACDYSPTPLCPDVIPATYFVHNNNDCFTDDIYLEAVNRAADYWNDVAETTLFEEGTAGNHDICIVIVCDMPGNMLGRASPKLSVTDHCLKSATIELLIDDFIVIFESVARHEFGHIVGFEDTTEDPDDLMFYVMVVFRLYDPKPLSENELLILEEMFK